MADSVKIKITGDDKEFNNTLSGIGQKAGSVFRGMMASQIVTKGISLLTSGLKSAINTGMQFEAAMNQVAAISGATGQELELLTETAKHYGETTMFSASQAAEALNYMALAGWDAQQSVDALGGVLDLAAASGMDLGAASDAVTDYLSAFSMEASQAGYMADLMAYAQSKSNTTASMLADAYGNCATSMHAAGQDIETTTAMLMALANQGIKGSEAGTQMAAVMRDLTQKMDNGQIMIGKTAVKITDAAGNFRDLNDIIMDVGKATEGMGTAEQSAAIMTTFTARSVKAIQTILNEGVANVNAYEDALRGSEGTAAEQASTMMDNLQGDIKIFQSALEGVQITASETMNSTARSIVQEGTSILEAVNQAGKSGGIGGMFDALIAQIPSLLPKVTKGVQSLLSGLGKRLPGLVKNLISTIPDVLGSGGDMAPMLIESLSEAVSAAIEGIITNLPQIVSSLAMGIGKSLVAGLKGIGNITQTLLDSIFGVKKPTEYQSYGNLTGELTYDVDTQANVDNSGAHKDVETARKTFISDLKGYGLDSDDIVKIIGFTGTEEEIQAKLKANYPDLGEAQRNAITSMLTSESGTAIQSAVADMESYGLTSDQIVEILAFDGTEAELEAKLKESLPDLKAVQLHALQAKLTSTQDAGTADTVTEATEMGLTVEQIAQLLAFTGTEEQVKAAIKNLLPDLSQAQRDALFEHFSETDFTTPLSQLSTDLGDMGLTSEQIAQLLVVKGEDGDLEGAIKDMLPDLDAAAQKAILNKLNENGGIASNLTSELSNLGIKPEDIVKLITYQGEGDTASIDSLLEEKYGELDIKGKAIAALEKAWSSSEATFSSGVEGSSLGYMAQLLTDMFTDGVNDDDASVDAMLANAKSVIDAAKQKLNEYIANGGEDAEGAQNVLTQLDNLDQAFTDYASNYANASKTVCAEQGAVLMDMANQCQEAVNSITASTQQLISLEENLFNRGKSGTKLTEADTYSAMNFISYKYQQAKADAEKAREDAIQAGADYETAEAAYQAAIARALGQSTRDIAALIKGQMGDVEGLDVGAALASVKDQLLSSMENGGGMLHQSEVEAVLRDAGYSDDIIGQAITAIFGRQTYDGATGLAFGTINDFLAGFDGLNDDLKEQLMTRLEEIGGTFSADGLISAMDTLGIDGDIMTNIVNALFTPDDMHLDNVDLDSILGQFDFGPLGDILKTAIENGLVEGVDSTDGIDINQLILQMIGDASKGGTTPEVDTDVDVNVETGDITTDDDTPEKVTEAVEEAAEGGDATASPTLTVEPEVEAADGTDEKITDAAEQAVEGTEEQAAQTVNASVDLGLTIGNVTVEGNDGVAGAVAQQLSGQSAEVTIAVKANVGDVTIEGGAAVNTAARQLVSNAVAAAQGQTSSASSVGRNFASGLASGILAGRSAVISAAISVASAAAAAARAALQINSPSRITEGFGRMFDQGFVVGIDKEAGSVVRSAVSLVNNVVGAANLSPKMDLSGLSASMNGAISDLADIESNRDIALYLNGREMARASTRDYNAALNGYAKRIGLGYGRG